jgi:hypothetical protein
MTKRRRIRIKVTINTRVEENPGEFRVDNGILFCNFCDHSIDWVRKLTVDDYLNNIMHKNNKQFLENKKHKHLLQLYMKPKLKWPKWSKWSKWSK